MISLPSSASAFFCPMVLGSWVLLHAFLSHMLGLLAEGKRCLLTALRYSLTGADYIVAHPFDVVSGKGMQTQTLLKDDCTALVRTASKSAVRWDTTSTSCASLLTTQGNIGIFLKK